MWTNITPAAAGARRDTNAATARRVANQHLCQQIAEALPREPRGLGRRCIDLGKLVAPVPRAASVDDGAAIGEVALRLALGLDARVERRRPSIMDDVDRGRGIGSGEHRPDQLLEVRHIDVVVGDDHVATCIGTRVAHGGDVSRLDGVPRVALLDRDAEQQPCGADFVRPGCGHVRHTGLDDVLAHDGGAGERAIARDLVRWALRRAPEQDRIVPMIDRFDVHHGLLADIAPVVAHPFAERPFRLDVARLDEPLNDDLGVGRYRQTGDRCLDDIDRFPTDAADDVVLANAIRHLARRHQERHRIAADHDRDRHRLLARLVLVALDAAVLAWRDVEADGLLVVDHYAVGAAVDPALVRIAGDVEAAGADIATPVGVVPFRCWKDRDVDCIARDRVLENWSVVHVARRNALQVGHVVRAEGLAQLELGEVARKSERHALALPAEEVHKNLAALERAGHIAEEDAGRVLVVQNDLGCHADILLPRQAIRLADLAELARLLDPLTQVAIGERRAQIGDRCAGHGAADRFAHAVRIGFMSHHCASPDTFPTLLPWPACGRSTMRIGTAESGSTFAPRTLWQ